MKASQHDPAISTGQVTESTAVPTVVRAKLLSIDEVVRGRLPISKATLYSWVCRRKGPPAVKIGGRLFFDESKLNAWIDSQPCVGGSAIVAAR